MQIESSLVYNLQNELKKEPVDFELTKKILVELIEFDAEPVTTNMIKVMQLMVTLLTSEIARLKQADSTKYVKANKLAIILKNNPYLISEFDVIEDNKADTIKISWRGQADKPNVYRGYDYLRIELQRFIGHAEFDNSTIARAIMQAKNYIRYDKEFLEVSTLESLIIEKAYSLLESRPNKRRITIPELKKEIASTSLSTKEVEQVLLNADWEIVKSGTCPTKFFRPKY